MSVLRDQKPLSVFEWFEQVCAIPHGSGNEAPLVDFIEDFARQRGLSLVRDEANNLLVVRPATAGYEEKPAVLLQGHLDMVCEQAEGVYHDFARDGLELFVDGDWIGARGTTLGGDDGIAVAYMLALLDGATPCHPRLECLFTVSEETGLIGAHAFDPTAAGVTAPYMINLDSEDESVITAGCAGGVRTDIHLPLSWEEGNHSVLRVSLSGLSGGHSGTEIMGGHANAIKMLSNILLIAFDTLAPHFRLISISGGGKDNAIPRSAEVLLCADYDEVALLLMTLAENVRREPWLISTDRSFDFRIESCGRRNVRAIIINDTKKALGILASVSDGVQAMSADLPGFPVYSRNLGILSTDDQGIVLSLSSRSPSESLLDASEAEMSALASGFGGHARHYARYPGWEFAPDSRLRSVWEQVYARQTGSPIRVETIHAGLECGILRHKMPRLDVISVGPTMRAIHTPDERLSISSTARVFDVLCDVLKQL